MCVLEAQGEELHRAAWGRATAGSVSCVVSSSHLQFPEFLLPAVVKNGCFPFCFYSEGKKSNHWTGNITQLCLHFAPFFFFGIFQLANLKNITKFLSHDTLNKYFSTHLKPLFRIPSTILPSTQIQVFHYNQEITQSLFVSNLKILCWTKKAIYFDVFFLYKPVVVVAH